MVAAGTLAPMSRFNILVVTGIYILKIAGQCLKVLSGDLKINIHYMGGLFNSSRVFHH